MFVDSKESQSTNRRIMWRPWVFTIALPVLASCFYPWIGGGRDLPILLFDSFLLSLSSVTGIWLGIANRWWRFLIAPFVIALIAFAIGSSHGVSFEWTGALIGSITVVIICLALETTKLIFGRFEIPDSKESMNDGLQFQIAHILITTAIVALFISGVKLLVNFAVSRAGSAPSGIYEIIAMFVLILALFTLTSTWALLGKSIKYKLAIAASISIVTLVVAPIFVVGKLDDWLWIVMLLICWLSITLQLWLIRVEGIRFVRK